jgi:hypothetical protein
MMMDSEGKPPPPPPPYALSSTSRSGSFGSFSNTSSPAVPSRSGSTSKKGRDGGDSQQEGWNVPLWKILWGGDNEEQKSDSQSNLKRGSQSIILFFIILIFRNCI